MRNSIYSIWVGFSCLPFFPTSPTNYRKIYSDRKLDFFDTVVSITSHNSPRNCRKIYSDRELVFHDTIVFNMSTNRLRIDHIFISITYVEPNRSQLLKSILLQLDRFPDMMQLQLRSNPFPVFLYASPGHCTLIATSPPANKTPNQGSSTLLFSDDLTFLNSVGF